ncbi:MAG: 2-nitropropane dioxygenase [Alphaproteobacteria bacterium]|nr:2-nitropropane dioxygenase [Alphaproteobacteria bacterium]
MVWIRSFKLNLQQLWQRGCFFLGTEYAILGGAMTWVSDRHLVSAISNEGGFGVVASGAMSPEQLDEEIKGTVKLTQRPFGVNLITMHPDLDRLVEVCAKNQVTHVVLAGGLPPASAIASVKAYGGKVLCFTPTLGFGRKLVKMGVDALIIEGNEAGGHVGPVSTSVLAQEILPFIREIPIFIAGGIGRGEAIVNYLELGASGVQLGTRFVCAIESQAHARFKQAFIRANARDAVSSVQLDPRFPVIPVRALANDATRRFFEKQKEMIGRVDEGEMDLKQAQLEVERFWAGSLRRAVVDGDVENGSLMAGQSVGMITQEQTTGEIIQELITQANAYILSKSESKEVKGATTDFQAKHINGERQ